MCCDLIKILSMKFRVFPIIILIIILFITSCSLPRVLEKSEKERPNWVYSIDKNHIIVEGVGYTWEEAQDDALKKINERIVNSVAVNVSSETSVSVNETVIDNISRYSQNTELRTNISTDFFNSLRGISFNKAENFYWEKQKHKDKTVKIHYHIMYPFSERELNGLLNEWVKMDRDFTTELDNLEDEVENCDRLSDLKLLHEKAVSLEEIFSGARKTRASLIKTEIEQLIEGVKFEIQSHERGRLILMLHTTDRYLMVNKNADFTSSCAVLQDQKIIENGKALEINYDADFCYSEDKASFRINQNYSGTNLGLDFLIPEGENTARFTISEPVRFKRSPIDLDNIRWYIPIRIFTEIPFIITKVELIVTHESIIDIRKFIVGEGKESYFVAEIEEEFDQKGDFSLQFDVPSGQNGNATLIGQLINIFVSESTTYFASGKIYIKPKNEDKEYVFVFENKRIVGSE